MKLSLATRIFIGYAAVLVTFGAVSLFSVAEMHKNQGEMRLLGAQGYLRLMQDTSALEGFPTNEKRELERVHSEPSPATRLALLQLLRRFPADNTARLAQAKLTARDMLAEAPSSERSFIQALLARWEELQRNYEASGALALRICELLGQRTVDAAALQPLWQDYGVLIDKVSRELKQLRGELERRVQQHVQEAEVRERRTGIAILGLSVLAIAVGLLATAISARTLRPVRTLAEGVSRVGRGDYSAQLGVRGDDEISVLAREFDKMAHSLREREAQLKEKQEALLRAEQLAAVGRISAQVAHEVRNPLSSIGLNVELLEESFAQAHFPSAQVGREAQEILASVLREVDRLTEVTDQYLRMAGVPQPSLGPESLNEVLTSVLDFSREELERARVAVVRELDPTNPVALADEGQLRQVFLNLVRNSREAMADGGTLVVRTRKQGSEVAVVFSDSGVGIPQEARGQVFEPFFSTKEGGTGLGLALTRQILQAHGGSIDFESGAQGGTTFVIRLQAA